ncbi:MAG: orotidine 5'-phosphate decarboxylase / HUMPS family protein [Promethearchaeota archaeon]
MSSTKPLKKGKIIPKLQIALDLEILEEALDLAHKIAPFVDILEAGTPLIKSEGIRVIKELKEAHPDKLVCADLKTADAGYLEVKMAAKSKADIITILADAYNMTIQEALRAANEFHVEIMADLIVSRSPAIRLAEIINIHYKETALHYAAVHSGLDRQASRQAPFFEIESVARIRSHPKLAVAGGIQVNDIQKLISYPIEIIIVGGAITRSKNPIRIAEEIRNEINRYTL